MNKTRILIVEDEVIVAADLEAMLSRAGYDVVGVATRGEEAVKLAFTQKPHLILMDIQLNGPMDGIETAQAINRMKEVPIVYLTAHSDQATLSRAKLSGPLGYILKPFDDTQLNLQIELAIYKHNADRQLHDQRELLQVTLQSIGDGVIATDAAGRISFFNRVAESLTGWPKETAIGNPIMQVLNVANERTQERLTHPLKDLACAGESSTPLSYWILTDRQARKLPVRISGSPIHDRRGRFQGFVVVFHDISTQRQAEKEKDFLIDELQNAMSKARMLSGMLPICSACKKIRDDKGYWNQIEAYISDHSQAEFSHSICPDCAARLYPDIDV